MRPVLMTASAILLSIVLAAQLGPELKTISPANLTSVEEQLERRVAAIRYTVNLKPLPVRRDIRVRQEACALSATNQISDESYVTEDPNELHPTFSRIAVRSDVPLGARLTIGVWYAKTVQHPRGAYWVVVHAGESNVSEWFNDHFYLTDTFEYRDDAKHKWKANLPQQCRDMK